MFLFIFSGTLMLIEEDGKKIMVEIFLKHYMNFFLLKVKEGFYRHTII